MGRKRDKKKPSAPSADSPSTSTISELVMAACVRKWGKPYGQMYGGYFNEAGPWTIAALRSISMDNATERVGLEPCRRIQVAEVAQEVADAIEQAASTGSDAEMSHAAAAEENGSSHHGTIGRNSSRQHAMAGLAAAAHKGTVRQLGETAPPPQVRTAVQIDVQETVPGVEESAAPAELSTACVALAVVSRFTRLLNQQSYYPQALQRVTAGFEAQWQQSVKSALESLQSEFRVADLGQKYDGFCAMGKELFLRELRSKSVRILAHKKRQTSKKSKNK